jgi:hypothetical protein
MTNPIMGVAFGVLILLVAILAFNIFGVKIW